MNPFTFKKRKSKNYFEGYYIRIIDESKRFNKAFIFGVTYYKEDPHAFIQLVDGDNNSTKYYRFDVSEFSYDKQTVYFKDNHLSLDHIYIKTDDFLIEGNIKNHVKIEKFLGSNSAMSFMHMFPMKTYQEIVYQHAIFEGTYKDHNTYQLNGISYMEKTYGHKFPPDWIWIQSNTFDQDILLSCSIGHTKIFGFKALGYVVSLIHSNKEIRFATYKRGKIYIDRSNGLTITVSNKKHKLIITAKHIDPITLLGPIDKGEMVREVYESITSEVEIILYENNEPKLKSKGRLVGMENMYEH